MFDYVSGAKRDLPSGFTLSPDGQLVVPSSYSSTNDRDRSVIPSVQDRRGGFVEDMLETQKEIERMQAELDAVCEKEPLEDGSKQLFSAAGVLLERPGRLKAVPLEHLLEIFQREVNAEQKQIEKVANGSRFQTALVHPLQKKYLDAHNAKLVALASERRMNSAFVEPPRIDGEYVTPWLLMAKPEIAIGLINGELTIKRLLVPRPIVH